MWEYCVSVDEKVKSLENPREFLRSGKDESETNGALFTMVGDRKGKKDGIEGKEYLDTNLHHREQWKMWKDT